MNRDEKYMRLALEWAKRAEAEGEVPVGAVCVLGDEIISVGRNRREGKGSAIAHAEVEAIALACQRLGGWNLWQCELYVTLEPCVMCTGAIINSRIKRVIYGARDVRAEQGQDNLKRLSCRATVTAGVLGQECSQLLSDFFDRMRAEKSAWLPSERVVIGDRPQPDADMKYEPFVCAVIPADGGYLLLEREDGLVEFPKVSRNDIAPSLALSEKCSGLEPIRRLVTVAEYLESDGCCTVRDLIFMLCKGISPRELADGWSAKVCCDTLAGMPAADMIAYGKIKAMDI